MYKYTLVTTEYVTLVNFINTTLAYLSYIAIRSL